METKSNLIILEKGEAHWDFFELQESEVRTISERILMKVQQMAAKIGQIPITIETIREKGNRKPSPQ